MSANDTKKKAAETAQEGAEAAAEVKETGSTAAENTAQSGGKRARTPGVYEHVFKRPFEYAGTTYEQITFDFNRLNGYAAVEIENEMQNVGEMCMAPEASLGYQVRMAARAADIGIDLLMALPMREFSAITAAARRFLLDSGF